MSTKTVDMPKAQDGVVLYDLEEKVFPDIKAEPGQKAFVFIHTVPFEGSVALVNLKTAKTLGLRSPSRSPCAPIGRSNERTRSTRGTAAEIIAFWPLAAQPRTDPKLTFDAERTNPTVRCDPRWMEHGLGVTS